KLDASAVGIDAPCCWSRTDRARPCERALATEGIHAFATPSQAVGEGHPFYRGMRNGADLYRLIMLHYRLFDGQYSTSNLVCFETFPHGVAFLLAGAGFSPHHKNKERRT